MMIFHNRFSVSHPNHVGRVVLFRVRLGNQRSAIRLEKYFCINCIAWHSSLCPPQPCLSFIIQPLFGNSQGRHVPLGLPLLTLASCVLVITRPVEYEGCVLMFLAQFVPYDRSDLEHGGCKFSWQPSRQWSEDVRGDSSQRACAQSAPDHAVHYKHLSATAERGWGLSARTGSA